MKNILFIVGSLRKQSFNRQLAALCRAKLNDLLEFMKMQVMKEPQTGIALGMEAWTKGEFNLTDEQVARLKTQAEQFAAFVNE